MLGKLILSFRDLSRKFCVSSELSLPLFCIELWFSLRLLNTFLIETIRNRIFMLGLEVGFYISCFWSHVWAKTNKIIVLWRFHFESSILDSFLEWVFVVENNTLRLHLGSWGFSQSIVVLYIPTTICLHHCAWLRSYLSEIVHRVLASYGHLISLRSRIIMLLTKALWRLLNSWIQLSDLNISRRILLVWALKNWGPKNLVLRLIINRWSYWWLCWHKLIEVSRGHYLWCTLIILLNFA